MPSDHEHFDVTLRLRGAFCMTAEENDFEYPMSAGSGEEFPFKYGDDVKRIGLHAHTGK